MAQQYPAPVPAAQHVANQGEDDQDFEPGLPIHRTEAGWPNCATCDGGGCLDCTDSAY